MLYLFIFYLQPQVESAAVCDGGKNCSVGNLILRNRSQAESSLEERSVALHSFPGIQKSYAGIKSWESRSKRTMVN